MNFELHSYNDSKIHLEYQVTSSNTDNLPSIILELYRGKLFCSIIKDFIGMSIDIFGTKIFSIKKSYPRTLTNLLSSWMFTLYASEDFNPSEDPFIPNNYQENDSLKNTLRDLIKYDESIADSENKIILLISQLKNIFKEKLDILKKYKKSDYYKENKNKYKITKLLIKQTRDVEYSFYKFNVHLQFQVKDKRLLNILDNLLIPIDEYEKLKSNYNGKKEYLDEYIWAILFRYQLLGSNNHQLGVKSDIMKQMKQDYDLNYECFASAINSTFNHYCSVYYDLDKFFGFFGIVK